MTQNSTPKTMHPILEAIKYKEGLVLTLCGGTEAMRNAGEEYLPKETEESKENYAKRLARSVLFPAYKQAVEANTGKLFINDLEVEKSTPEMDNILLEVDEDDNDITAFAKIVTESAIHQGCSYILVDFPVMASNSTLADEIAVGGTPYWIHVQQSQVLEASPIRRNGKRILGVFRYTEDVAIREDEFTVKYIEQIKQFSFNETGNVIYTIYRKDPKNGKWFVFADGELIGANSVALTEIPISAVNLNSVAFYTGEPVFYDLAEENTQHWQMTSDYNNIVHYCQVPMLKQKGADQSNDENGVPKSKVVISPNTVINIENPEGDIEWLEVTGAAAEVGKTALDSSEERMAAMSLQLLANTEEGTSATASRIDAVESLSRLQSMGKVVEQGINKAIIFTYNYLGVENKNTAVSLDVSEAVDMSNDLTENGNTTENNNASKASSEGNADTNS